MMTLGAIVIFGIMIMRINTSELDTGERVDNSKFSVMAMALAKSRIDNAFALKFDANTVYGTVYPDANGNPPSNSLTAANGLGPSSAEASSKIFNDFDDYHNFTSVIDTIPSATFTVTSRVAYVDVENGYVTTTSPTWNKQITVVVTSDNLERPITLRAINSYWTF